MSRLFFGSPVPANPLAFTDDREMRRAVSGIRGTTKVARTLAIETPPLMLRSGATAESSAIRAICQPAALADGRSGLEGALANSRACFLIRCFDSLRDVNPAP